MSDKNHEQYLEQIETAVTETTEELMSNINNAKLVAEKQVEINRLREYQSNDRNTIRKLRAQFKVAVDEVTELKQEVQYHKETAEVDKWKSWASEVIYWSHSASKDILGKKKLITDTNQPTIADVRDFGKEITELKARVTTVSDGWAQVMLKATSKHAEKIALLEDENKKLKEEFKKLKEEKDGICGKYHADFCELEEKREEVKELEQEVQYHKETAEVGVGLANSFRKDIEELKKELEKLKGYILMNRGRDTHKEFCECLGEDFGIKYENILYPENPDNNKLILQYKQD
tara:strand:+ start:800 stop:1669 length:870 start_codon:yes stop_codon:yes gene_type:complete